MYRRLMHGLEHQLHARDFAQRVVRPFEWGLEFLGADGNGNAPSQPLEYLKQYNEKALEQSAEFFTPAPAQAADFSFDSFLLRYPSSITTPYAQNNLVHARYYP